MMSKSAHKLGTFLLVILMAGFAMVALPAQAQPADEAEMVLTLTDVSPAVLQPGDPLTLRGTIQNTTDEPIENPTMSLVLQQVSPTASSMADIEGWIAGDDDWRTTRLTWQDSGQTIDPGATVPWTLTLESDQSPFDSASQWGPRGIQVEFVHGGQTASVRSVILWHPGATVPIPVADVALVLPLTPTWQEWEQAIEQQLPVSEVAGPRLLALIEQFNIPEVAWALDPAVLTSSYPDDEDPSAPESDPSVEPAEPSSTEPTTEPASESDSGTFSNTPSGTPGGTPNGTPSGTAGEPGPTGTENGQGEGSAPPDFPDAATTLPHTNELITALASGSQTHEVVLLPWGNADLNGLTTDEVKDGDGSHLVAELQEHGKTLANQHGIRFQPQVTWPVQPPTPATLAALDSTNHNTLILPRSVTAQGGHSLGLNSGANSGPNPGPTSDQDPSREPAESQNPGVTQNPADPGNLLTLTDAVTFTRGQISAEAGRFQTVVIDEVTSPALFSSAVPVENRQLSLSAIAYAVRGNLDDSLLLSLPTTELDARELEALNSALLAIDQSPFSELMPLRSIVGDTDVEEHTVVKPQPVGLPLATQTINDVGLASKELAALAQILAENPRIESNHDQMLNIFSSQLQLATAARAQLITQSLDRVALMGTWVSIEPGSTLNLISQRGDVPVTVRNDADYPATVTVELQPNDQRLTAEETQEITIPPRTAVTARIPVTAIANGNVEVSVQLRSASGTVVGQPQSFSMRVRADWENTGTAIAAGAVGLVFVIGLVRSIVRSRSSKDSTTHVT